MPSPADELRNAIVAGRAVRRGGGEPAAEGGGWGEERQLPADLLYELLVRPEDGVKPRAAVLVGLRITGRLNLESAELQAPLIAHNCHFDAPVNLTAAKAPQISLAACHLPAIAADQLETRGTLNLTGSTLGILGLLGASIGGDLELVGTTVMGGEYPPKLGDGTLRPPETPTDTFEGMGIVADRLQVAGGMFCGQGFTAEAEVRLLGAHIGNQLAFNGATLRQGLDADRVQVDGSMFCTEGFTADGEIRLLGGQIGGQLTFNGATLGQGLNADGLQVAGGMFCSEGFTAGGEVRLLGAQIGNQLAFHGATLRQGLNADRLQVDGDMFCREGFTADGEVRLLGVRVGGQLAFNGAKLRQGLNADDLQVDGSLFFTEGFEAGAGVRMVGARIGGQLNFLGAALMSTGDALELEGTRVDGAVWLRFRTPPMGRVGLASTQLGSLYDSESTWPPRLSLGGCVYGGLAAAEDASREHGAEGEAGLAASLRRRLRLGGRPDVKRRLRWIRLAEEGGGYAPSPYAQLMTFYRREGRDGDARRVAYERERRRRGELGPPGKTWNSFLQWTVGYGYKPLRAVVLLAALVIVGSLAFSSFHDDGSLTATKTDHQPFLASIYTLDRLVPVVSLGLRDTFAPSGAAQWWAFAYTLLGWMLTVAVVAGVNAAVRRD